MLSFVWKIFSWSELFLNFSGTCALGLPGCVMQLLHLSVLVSPSCRLVVVIRLVSNGKETKS